MTMQVRAGFLMIVALAMMGLAGCDHYNCSTGPMLGGSCTAGTPGIGTTTPGSATAAFVFVADATGSTSNGTIDGYTLNTSASTFGPTPTYTAPATPLNDGGVGMVVAQAKYLYTGFGSTGTGTIYGWSIGSAGTLTALSGSPYAAPFMPFVPVGFGTQSIITNPTGSLLFFSAEDNGTGTLGPFVYVFQIGSDGSLTAASGSPFSVPFTGNLATDGLGKYLYITEAFTNHTGSEIAAYSIGTTGALTLVSGSPFAGNDFNMWQVQGEPSGKFMIGTTGESIAINTVDNDKLYVFSIGTTGALSEVSGSPFVTQSSPLSIAVQSDANGSLIYTFGLTDDRSAFNSVEGYSINSSGALSAVTGSPFSNAAVGDQGALDQSGNFLFVYGVIDNLSTNTIVPQMGAFSVASGGALTEPTTTLTLTSPGFFAVTDPQ
jgi:6-phosphogluconolactonase